VVRGGKEGGRGAGRKVVVGMDVEGVGGGGRGGEEEACRGGGKSEGREVGVRGGGVDG